MNDQTQSNNIGCGTDLDSVRELKSTPTFPQPGTQTQPNSPTRYFEFASATLAEPLPASFCRVLPPQTTKKTHGAKKKSQPTTKPRRSERLREKKKQMREERRERRKHSELDTDPGLQQFEKQLRLLEEWYEERSELSS